MLAVTDSPCYTKQILNCQEVKVCSCKNAVQSLQDLDVDHESAL